MVFCQRGDRETSFPLGKLYYPQEHQFICFSPLYLLGELHKKTWVWYILSSDLICNHYVASPIFDNMEVSESSALCLARIDLQFSFLLFSISIFIALFHTADPSEPLRKGYIIITVISLFLLLPLIVYIYSWVSSIIDWVKKLGAWFRNL